jgi:hypothetical protein
LCLAHLAQGRGDEKKKNGNIFHKVILTYFARGALRLPT